ncbi:Uncharacterised protein [Segatella copri]|nr:Uncharacterised protein [Segatella copri]
MDAAFQNLVQGIAADDGILVSTDTSATHHQIGYHTCRVNAGHCLRLSVLIAGSQHQCSCQS